MVTIKVNSVSDPDGLMHSYNSTTVQHITLNSSSVAQNVEIHPISTLDWFFMALLFLSITFLGLMMTKCITRGMQGKFDLNPDVMSGQAAGSQLGFVNPFKTNRPLSQSQLAPPPRSPSTSEVSGKTNESICMDYIDLEIL